MLFGCCIADVGRAVTPHRMHHDGKLSRQRDTRLGVALCLREPKPPGLDEIASLKRVSIADAAS